MRKLTGVNVNKRGLGRLGVRIPMFYQHAKVGEAEYTNSTGDKHMSKEEEQKWKDLFMLYDLYFNDSFDLSSGLNYHAQVGDIDAEGFAANIFITDK